MRTVTIGVIAYNEEKCINNIFDNIIAQDYDHNLIDIVLVDGISSDNTKEIMTSFATDNVGKFNRIAVVDNIKRVQPAGLNCVIKNSDTDVIIRLDAHSCVPNNFVTKNIECIDSGENVCGGQVLARCQGQTKLNKIVFVADNAMFGAGIAAFRRGTSKSYVKTTAQGCYKREVFEKVGGYNEYLQRSEDNEMHYRIRKAGYKICFDEGIKSEYMVRSTIRGTLKQKYGNGKWIGITSGLSLKIFSLYHYIPLLFVLGIVATAICAMVGIAFPQLAIYFAIPAILMWGAYAILILAMSAVVAVKQKSVVMLVALPVLFLLLHVSYGVGTVVGLVEMPFRIKGVKNSALPKLSTDNNSKEKI